MIPALTIPAPLARGASGPMVQLAQEWLAFHLGPAYPTNLWAASPACVIDGVLGPRMEQCLRAFQSWRGLPPTGELTPETFAHLTAPMADALLPLAGAADLNEALIALAQRYLALGVREVRGNNLGPWVRLFCGSDGAWMSWCAGFVSQLVQQAAAVMKMSPPFAHSISCDVLGHSARLNRKLVAGTDSAPAVRPGSLVLFRAKPGNSARKEWHHVELLTAIHGDRFETIGGNTNADGSPDGYGVFAHSRRFGGVDFVSIGSL